MKILICEIKKQCENLEWEGQYLRQALDGENECIFHDGVVGDYKGDLAELEVLSTFIHSQVKSDLLDKMPALRLILTRSTGYDHIDVAECDKRGITVCNVPFYGENTVAEYAFALLLTLLRNTYEASDRTKKSNYSLDGLMGYDLKGKTFGVVGGGHIGIHALQIAKGFGMVPLCFDVKPDPKLAVEYGFEYVSLADLYQRADIISLHVPLIPPTKHMINKEAFAKMKDGVVLINTARGGIIDTNAMIDALSTGKLYGVALDVVEEEEFIVKELQLVDETQNIEQLREVLENHILMDHPRAVVTFHNAFNTREGRQRILDVTVENFQSYIKGKIMNQVK